MITLNQIEQTVPVKLSMNTRTLDQDVIIPGNNVNNRSKSLVKQKVLHMLARRDHSRREIYQKLISKA